jgi:hypothetical protein
MPFNQFGMDDGPEFFAPWAVTKENYREALNNAYAILRTWEDDSARGEQWAENTDQVVSYVAEILYAVLRVTQ